MGGGNSRIYGKVPISDAYVNESRRPKRTIVVNIRNCSVNTEAHDTCVNIPTKTIQMTLNKIRKVFGLLLLSMKHLLASNMYYIIRILLLLKKRTFSLYWQMFS